MKHLKFLLLLLPLDALAHPGHDGLAALPGLVQGLLLIVVVLVLLGGSIYQRRKTKR